MPRPGPRRPLADRALTDIADAGVPGDLSIARTGRYAIEPASRGELRGRPESGGHDEATSAIHPTAGQSSNVTATFLSKERPHVQPLVLVGAGIIVAEPTSGRQ